MSGREPPRPDGEPAAQRRRTVSSSFDAAARGEALAPRAREVPLAGIDDSSSSAAAVQPPAAAGGGSGSGVVHVVFLFTVPNPAHPSRYVCKLCGKDVNSAGGSGNLSKHLRKHHSAAHELLLGNEANKRALLADLIREADTNHRRQSSLGRWVARRAKAPANVLAEARWILWLSMSGVSYNAISNPLFLWARKGRINARSLLTLHAGGQSRRYCAAILEDNQGVNALLSAASDC